ncbi:hypothetical protein BH18ACT11_BH18ACT11_22230 [soil metagenome]
MESSGLVRWGALGLFLGGTVWLLLGLLNVFDGLLAIPGRKDDVVLLALGLVLTAAGLVGPHALQGRSYGLLGRAGFYIAIASLLARALRDVIFLVGSQTLLQWIVRPSVLGMMVGLVLMGTATLRARVLPRWYGLALIVSILPVLLPIRALGTALFGVIMLVLGFALWMRSSAEQGRSTSRGPMWGMLAVFVVLGIGEAVQGMSASPTGKDVVYQIIYQIVSGMTSAILIMLAVAVLILLPGGIYYVSARTEGATFRESIFNWPLVTLAGIVAFLSLI